MISACRPFSANNFHSMAPNNGKQQIEPLG
jgi:hypothetical protein